MKSMTGSEIRKRFLDFFKEKGHTVVRSDLLVPKNDPTLLFTGAGMNQFKEQFMGRNIEYSRAASSQKCLRTGDLENVGRTPRHHTFFEMLGNFSFGDYFKKDAILWAWEFMTDTLGIPSDLLWISVYKDDDESYGIWSGDVGIPEEKIVRLGEHENFWPQDAPSKGPNGPCGPCSEIFFDRGEAAGCGDPGCGPACDCGRFVEVWNLVFTQFERKPDGSLIPLPNSNIDTGMGLERVAAVMQGAETNFGTDLFRDIIADIVRNTGTPGGVPVEKKDLHLMADHVRAVTFVIADGVSPSNEKQGYVVRKLIRRAYLKGGAGGPFMYKIIPTVVRVMKDAYPELEEQREHIAAIVEEEEKRFKNTIDFALPVLEEMLAGKPERLSGADMFKLVDTYGLPVDVIEEKAGVPLDIEGFERLMDERKEQSRRGSDITEDFIFKPDRFSGVTVPPVSDTIPLETRVEFILAEDRSVECVKEGERAEIVTSPQSGMFYAEGGGQVGDSGHIEKNGAEIKVLDTFEADGRRVHVVFVKRGELSKGDNVTLHLDSGKKQKTALNHTATHLLQAALRTVLGGHVKQSGSAVDTKRLRFDFSHMKKLSDRELGRVEEMVNGWVADSLQVAKEVKPLEQARAEGALSFFGEKYGDTVRVVSVGDVSSEFCGGTHVDNTGDIGIIKITGESAVASGIRRIEAVTGETAEAWIKETLDDLVKKIKAQPFGTASFLEKDIGDAAEAVISGRTKIDGAVIRDIDERIKPALLMARGEIEKDAKKRRKNDDADAFNRIKGEMDALAAAALELGGMRFVSGTVAGADMQLLRKAAGYLEKRLEKSVILVGASSEEKAYLICAVTPDLADTDMDARTLIASVSGHIGGSGGGKQMFAQAGGKTPEGLEAAIAAAGEILQKRGTI